LLPLGTPLPSEGLGEALPFGEGTGVRLFVESKIGFRGTHPLLSEGLGEAVC
jgi:hypothetical protein